MIPLDLILPVEASTITPFFPTVSGSDPICSVDLGSAIAIPTFPSL